MPPSNSYNPDSLSITPTFWRGVNTMLFDGDTIVSAYDTLPPTQHHTFFLQKGTKGDLDSQPRIQSDIDWWYGSFAIILIVIVFLKLVYARQLNHLLKVFFVPGKISESDRFFPFHFDLFVVLFLLIYCISFALLTVSVVKDFNLIPAFTSTIAINLFFFSALAFFVLLVVKSILVQLVASFFLCRFIGLYYRDLMLASSFVTSAFIVPLIVVNVFSSSLIPIFIALGIVVLFTLYRLFRAVSVSLENKAFSTLHFILYLCTLEALPMILLGKTIQVFLMPS